MRRSLLGAAIGGCIGGGLNGLSLYARVPQDVTEFKPWIVIAGCWHGACLAFVTRLALEKLRGRRFLLPFAGYVAGTVGGMVGVLVHAWFESGLHSWFSSLGTWKGWWDWGLRFGGPVGLALGIAGALPSARNRFARVVRSVAVCAYLCAAAGVVFWWFAVGEGRIGYLPTGLTHGAIFGACYALGVLMLPGVRLPGETDRVPSSLETALSKGIQ